MRIMMVASEAVPFAKTGGLADVVTGLSKSLAASEDEVALVVPCYRRHISESDRGDEIGQVTIEILHTSLSAEIYETRIPDSQVRVFLVDRPSFFDRDGLYLEGGHDYGDNAERFLFFSRAAVEVARKFFTPDVIHSNDWQTGLVPGLILQERENQGELGNIATIYTIHNMAFHGEFPSLQMTNTGMDPRYFNWEQLEYFGNLNLLKGGIAMADMVNTVSPTYAKETCLPEFGYGLDPVLESRGEDYIGILNGVDMTVWNPEFDSQIAMQYNFQSYKEGKAECKAALQEEMGLPQNPNAMLFGLVSRLTDQKGLDLITNKATQILHANVQLVFLGAGDSYYEGILKKLQEEYPEKVAAYIGFQDGLAHRIEAGSDAFLMPSRFEPCGLNQQYSQIYGTPPIVHAVGGLTDSVVDAQRHTLDNGTATGFVFHEYDADTFIDAVWRAVGMFVHHTEDWNKLVLNCMVKDSSWDRIAQEYLDMYERAIEKLK